MNNLWLQREGETLSKTVLQTDSPMPRSIESAQISGLFNWKKETETNKQTNKEDWIGEEVGWSGRNMGHMIKIHYINSQRINKICRRGSFAFVLRQYSKLVSSSLSIWGWLLTPELQDHLPSVRIVVCISLHTVSPVLAIRLRASYVLGKHLAVDQLLV